MPEQNEWTNDSGDYRWHPEFARTMTSTSTGAVPSYDTRTVGQHVAEIEQRIKHLEAVVHKYINRTEGTL